MVITHKHTPWVSTPSRLCKYWIELAGISPLNSVNIIIWCNNNLSSYWCYTYPKSDRYDTYARNCTKYWFESEEDKVLFGLRWG